ncbi:MAG: clostripain-related cysteine peptidase [Pyrinomonadaceae bacterium]|nr:clostripain-related cysteine peptidase [Pyrinomonadaceae bacterium]
MGEDNSRKWTIMVYMAGDNNLSEECVYSLTEMKEGLVPTNDLTVVAQFDPSGVKTRTRRYLLRPAASSPGHPGTSLEEDALPWTAAETNTGEPANLLDFMRWGIAEYKAENFMVVLVGHGSGTDDDFLLRDENPSDALSISELQEVFKKITEDGHKIAILGMDTCLMNMAEVCYELSRTEIEYVVGSEGFSPNTGWPYKVVLQELIKKIDSGGANPAWLAKLIVGQYAEFYNPYIAGGISVDQSALVREKSPLLTQAFSKLVDALRGEIRSGELGYLRPPPGDEELPRNKPKQNALILAHWEAQSFNGEVFVDLFDFCKLLRSRYLAIPTLATEPVPKACDDVMTAVKDLVLKSCFSGAAFQYAYGVSIYFPWAVVSPHYENLAFPKETKWFDFLREYAEVTRRPRNPRAHLMEEDVGRASVPTNKGRDGKVESMRNPPFEPGKSCNDAMPLDAMRPQASQRRKGSPSLKKKSPVAQRSRQKR